MLKLDSRASGHDSEPAKVTRRVDPSIEGFDGQPPGPAVHRSRGKRAEPSGLRHVMPPLNEPGSLT